MSGLDQVFGISNEIVESYIERKQVDAAFSDAIKKSKKQVIVYGASKQGKTVLLGRWWKCIKNPRHLKYLAVEVCS